MPDDFISTVRAFFADWAARDPDVLLAYFADGAEWTEANRETARGREAIRAVFEVQLGFGSEFSFEFHAVAASGDLVLMERTDRFVINGSPMVVPVAGVMEFDGEGRIRSWRDYYDWSALERQLIASGVDMSGVEDG